MCNSRDWVFLGGKGYTKLPVKKKKLFQYQENLCLDRSINSCVILGQLASSREDGRECGKGETESSSTRDVTWPRSAPHPLASSPRDQLPASNWNCACPRISENSVQI